MNAPKNRVEIRPLTKEEGGGWLASFPDLPGCMSDGETPEEALRNPDVFIAALATVARARGMTQLAKDSGLSRESLYKTLAPGAKPRFETIVKITKALGVPMAPVATVGNQAVS